MNQEFVVLRLDPFNHRRAIDDPFVTPFNIGDDEPSSRLEVAVEEVSPEGLRHLQNDNNVKAFAPELPVELIRPMGEPQEITELQSDIAWGVREVGADASTSDGTGVVVAVLDTGIDKAHPAFADMSIIEKDFTGSGNGDVQGHGTHCAGTIFGRDVNGCRIGIARGVSKALIGKVLDDNGRGSTLSIMQGITWALDNGANVISLSLGISFPHYVEQLMIKGMPELLAISMGLEAYRANLRLFDSIITLIEARANFTQNPTLLIAASGNESERPNYALFAAPPSSATGAVSVGAVDENMRVAVWSNKGPSLVGPGVNIISAKPGNGLVAMSGTSMAAPHVAGVAALWAQTLQSQGQPFTTDTLEAALINNTDPRPRSLNPLIDIGSGLVHAP